MLVIVKDRQNCDEAFEASLAYNVFHSEDRRCSVIKLSIGGMICSFESVAEITQKINKALSLGRQHES